jgi:hypothetical protein
MDDCFNGKVDGVVELSGWVGGIDEMDKSMGS